MNTETADIAKQLARIADALETLGRVGLNISGAIQDDTNFVCATVAESFHALTVATLNNKPPATRRKPSRRAKSSRA